MKALLSVAAGACLLASVSVTVAQPAVEFEWTPEHEHSIYSHIDRDHVRTPPPADFDVRIGAPVPEAVELYDMPPDVEYAPVKRYRYTVAKNRVYVVEPSSRKVVRIIER